MASLLCLVLSAAVAAAAILPAGARAGGEHQLGLRAAFTGRPACAGTVGECMGEVDDEAALDWGSRRRVLAGTSGYISYRALSPDTIPCSARGNSYYSNNCRAGAAVNPYSRPCSQIYKCRTG